MCAISRIECFINLCTRKCTHVQRNDLCWGCNHCQNHNGLYIIKKQMKFPPFIKCTIKFSALPGERTRESGFVSDYSPRTACDWIWLIYLQTTITTLLHNITIFRARARNYFYWILIAISIRVLFTSMNFGDTGQWEVFVCCTTLWAVLCYAIITTAHFINRIKKP